MSGFAKLSLCVALATVLASLAAGCGDGDQVKPAADPTPIDGAQSDSISWPQNFEVENPTAKAPGYEDVYVLMPLPGDAAGEGALDVAISVAGLSAGDTLSLLSADEQSLELGSRAIHQSGPHSVRLEVDAAPFSIIAQTGSNAGRQLPTTVFLRVRDESGDIRVDSSPIQLVADLAPRVACVATTHPVGEPLVVAGFLDCWDVADGDCADWSVKTLLWTDDGEGEAFEDFAQVEAYLLPPVGGALELEFRAIDVLGQQSEEVSCSVTVVAPHPATQEPACTCGGGFELTPPGADGEPWQARCVGPNGFAGKCYFEFSLGVSPEVLTSESPLSPDAGECVGYFEAEPPLPPNAQAKVFCDEQRGQPADVANWFGQTAGQPCAVKLWTSATVNDAEAPDECYADEIALLDSSCEAEVLGWQVLPHGWGEWRDVDASEWVVAPAPASRPSQIYLSKIKYTNEHGAYAQLQEGDLIRSWVEVDGAMFYSQSVIIRTSAFDGSEIATVKIPEGAESPGQICCSFAKNPNVKLAGCHILATPSAHPTSYGIVSTPELVFDSEEGPGLATTCASVSSLPSARPLSAVCACAFASHAGQIAKRSAKNTVFLDKTYPQPQLRYQNQGCTHAGCVFEVVDELGQEIPLGPSAGNHCLLWGTTGAAQPAMLEHKASATLVPKQVGASDCEVLTAALGTVGANDSCLVVASVSPVELLIAPQVAQLQSLPPEYKADSGTVVAAGVATSASDSSELPTSCELMVGVLGDDDYSSLSTDTLDVWSANCTSFKTRCTAVATCDGKTVSDSAEDVSVAVLAHENVAIEIGGETHVAISVLPPEWTLKFYFFHNPALPRRWIFSGGNPAVSVAKRRALRLDSGMLVDDLDPLVNATAYALADGWHAIELRYTTGSLEVVLDGDSKTTHTGIESFFGAAIGGWPYEDKLTFGSPPGPILLDRVVVQSLAPGGGLVATLPVVDLDWSIAAQGDVSVIGSEYAATVAAGVPLEQGEDDCLNASPLAPQGCRVIAVHYTPNATPTHVAEVACDTPAKALTGGLAQTCFAVTAGSGPFAATSPVACFLSLPAFLNLGLADVASHGHHQELNVLAWGKSGSGASSAIVKLMPTSLCASGASGFDVDGSWGHCDDLDPCTSDQCLESGCAHGATDDGTSCDDGNECTYNDICVSGLCKPGKTLPPASPCMTTKCDGGSNLIFVPVVEGGACDDGNLCTVFDACVAGNCVGAPVDPDDGNPCTFDACHPAGGQTHQSFSGVLGDGTACVQGVKQAQFGPAEIQLAPGEWAVIPSASVAIVSATEDADGLLVLAKKGKASVDGNASALTSISENAALIEGVEVAALDSEVVVAAVYHAEPATFLPCGPADTVCFQGEVACSAQMDIAFYEPDTGGIVVLDAGQAFVADSCELVIGPEARWLSPGEQLRFATSEGAPQVFIYPLLPELLLNGSEP